MNIKEINFSKFVVPMILLFLFIGTIFGIVNYQRTKNTETYEKPKEQDVVKDELKIIKKLEPENTMETNSDTQEISGKLNGRRNKVTINGEKQKLDRGNTFKKEVALKEGENEIIIVAENAKGEKETKRIIIRKIVLNEQGQPKNEEGKVLGSETQKDQVTNSGINAENGALVGNGALAETGPKENAAMAITFIGIVLYFWRKSRLAIRVLR